MLKVNSDPVSLLRAGAYCCLYSMNAAPRGSLAVQSGVAGHYMSLITERRPVLCLNMPLFRHCT